MAFLFVVNSLTLRKPKKATDKAACIMSRSWVESDFFECRDFDRSLSIFMVIFADPDPAACFLWSPLRASLSLEFPVTGLRKPFEWWRYGMAALIVFTLNVLLRWAANSYRVFAGWAWPQMELFTKCRKLLDTHSVSTWCGGGYGVRDESCKLLLYSSAMSRGTGVGLRSAWGAR